MQKSRNLLYRAMAGLIRSLRQCSISGHHKHSFLQHTKSSHKPRPQLSNSPTTIIFGEEIYAFRELRPQSRDLVQLDGLYYKTAAHAFQSTKFQSLALKKKIQRSSTARDAIRVARNYAIDVRDDWTSVEMEMLDHVQYLKFTQHSFLTQFLISTGDARLIYKPSSTEDCVDGGDGENKVGESLMRVRERLMLDHNVRRSVRGEQSKSLSEKYEYIVV